MAGHLVILAGGKGTRLKERLGDLPKPMVPIAQRPLLEHQIVLARDYEFSQITLLLGYGAEKIRAYFGNGAAWNVEINYIVEPVPRGTAGAVLKALDWLPDRFLIMYGDTMLNVDLRRFYNAHLRSNADATLFLHPNDHPQDSDLVDVDTQSRITAFYPYPHNPERYFPNLVNAALYVLEKTALENYKDLTGAPDFGRHLFPKMLSDGRVLYGYRSPEYIKDIGTPKRLDKAEADFQSGRIQHGSLAHPAPAVFLDRDGTLNVEKNRISSAVDLELLPHVAQAIRRLNHSIYRTIIVTNQPVVARGDCSESELKEIHNKLETLLGREGAYVNVIYYCPHHPDRGFPGERQELKITCSCRKPMPGLVDQAIRELNIDREHSWFIGDSTIDLLTAQNAGLKSILLRTGHAGQDNRYPVKADFEFCDLAASVDFILDAFPKVVHTMTA
jgi:histidinol-phosphate phosphatase family protein